MRDPDISFSEIQEPRVEPSPFNRSWEQEKRLHNRTKLLGRIGAVGGMIGLLVLGVTLWKFSFSREKPTAPMSTTDLPALSGVPGTSPLPSAVPEESLRASPSSLPELPTAKTLLGGTHTFQTFNNCGPAALSMALSHYGIQESQQTLGQALRPYQQARGDNDDKSVTLAEVAAKAREHDLLTYLRPAGSVELIEAFVANDMPVIARTWLRADEDIGHFRVVKGYDRSRGVLIQDDSLQGKDLEYSYADFSELWSAFNYEFLVLVPPEKQALAEQILGMGELLDEQAAWSTALALAEAEVQENSRNVLATFNQSVALYHLVRYQDAISAYERVADRLPARTLWYQLEPVLAYYQTGAYDEVLRISNRILANDNRAYSELYFVQGLIAQQRQQSAVADEAFAAAALYNQSPYWKVNLP